MYTGKPTSLSLINALRALFGSANSPTLMPYWPGWTPGWSPNAETAVLEGLGAGALLATGAAALRACCAVDCGANLAASVFSAVLGTGAAGALPAVAGDGGLFCGALVVGSFLAAVAGADAGAVTEDALACGAAAPLAEAGA